MIGETISHYEILEKLGEGGMGVVYRARDKKLGRDVAIKFLPPHLSTNTDAARRFEHEAKAASALNHPNIGTIHEIDETENGATFIVMAYYEGQSLRDMIDSGQTDLDSALDIVSQIAAGLAMAHKKGIVHRDIKPSNILITSDGRAEIIDFGLAKLAGGTRLTMEGSTVGTAAYMSPEQAKGEELDHRSDIFSLGVILCEMLSGSQPFKGEHEAALLYEIVHEQPEPVSVCGRELPDGLQEVVDRAMAKNPDDRYQSADEFIQDLEGIRKDTLQGYTVRSQRAASGKYRAIRGRLLAAVVVITVVAAAFIIRHLWPPAPAEGIVLAIVDFTDLSYPDDQTLSAGLTGLVHTGLVEVSPCRVVSPTHLQDIRRRRFGQQRGPIDNSEALEIARESGATILLSGQVMPGGGAYVTWELVEVNTGRSVAAERIPGAELIELADCIVERVMPFLAEQCGTDAEQPVRSVSDLMTADPRAYGHLVAGLLAREEARYSEELDHLMKAVSLDSTFARALYELSRSYSRESDQAGLYAERAWENRSRLGTKDLMLLEAWRHWVGYRLQESFEVHRQLLERWPDDRNILESLMSQLFGQWYPSEALEIAKKGLDLYPDNYEFSQTYCFSLAALGDMEQALKAVRAHAELHSENVGARDDLGLMYLWMGMPDSAETVFKANLSSNPDYWWSQFGLAASAYFKGDVEGAITEYQNLLRMDGVTDHYRLYILNQMVNIYPGLSLLCAEAGRFREAFGTIERSREYAKDDTQLELRYVTAPRNTLLLRYGEAEEVLRWAREMRSSGLRIARWQAMRSEGEALAAMDSMDAAHAIIKELKDIEPEWGGFAGYMAFKISALRALAEGRPKEALTLLEESKMIHGVPCGSYYWLEWNEILASAYEAAGRLEDAVHVHQEVLRIYGGHAVSHYELGRLHEKLGRPTDAVWEYKIFLEMWKNADKGLPQPDYAKDRLKVLKSI